MTGSTSTSHRRALIVEDGDGLQILTALRSLGRAGWHVGLGHPDGGSRSDRSKYVSAVHQVPRPEEGLDAFVDAVARAVTEGGYEVVFPGDDIEMLALSAYRDAVGACVPYADHDAVLRSVDKLALTEAAHRVGLDAPVTVVTVEEAMQQLELPVIVKARLHWSPESAASQRHLLVRICDDWDSARARVQEIEAVGGSAMVQEVVRGELTAMTMVVGRDGELAAVSQQRTTMASLRRTSVRAETTDVDPKLRDRVHALLGDLGWFGLANLQFLVVPDRQPLLIDFNGRYYGSMALAVAAGADVPAVWADLAVGAPGRPLAVARSGVRFQNFEEDLNRCRVQRSGGLARDLAGVVAAFPRATHAMWSASDAGPTAALLRTLVARRVRRLPGLTRRTTAA